jgi:hypothetical protein
MFDLSLVLTPLRAVAGGTTTAAAAPATGCTGLEAINPLCYAVSAVGSIGGSVAAAGVDAVLSGLSQWVASGAEWLLSQIGNVLVSTTTVDLGASWFRTHYEVMTALAGVVVLPLLLLSTLQAIYRQSAGQLLRAFFVQLPLALLLGVVAIQIVILCLSATDALCAEVAGGSGSDVKALLSGMTHGLGAAVGDPTMATFVLLLVALLVAAAAFVLWLELLVRAAAVYVAVLFLPLALATLVWPSVAHWCRRLVETLTALILSKFVIVATLSLAAGAVASGTAGTGDAGSGFASVLAGGALLVLATFVPFSILRLIPMVEAGAIGHLDGVRQRSTAALTRVPRTAAQHAMSKAMDAHGAAKLAAMSGPPGTRGATNAVTGGALAGAAGGKGSGGMVNDQAGAEEDCNDGNGGLVPNENGMMIGLRGSEEEFLARMAADPPPRGPRPILPSPAEMREARRAASEKAQSAGGEGDATLPPGWTLIGKPGPYDRRYAMSHDHIGPVIHGLPPLRERPDASGSGPAPGHS